MLGSGTSSGVPRIGNDWGDCDPHEPRNRRTRASILVETNAIRVLVDTTPDMRQQLLNADIADVDAVIWTHDHADHCHGIDDLRQLYHVRGRPVIGYARPDVLSSLRHRFAYAFEGHDGYPPIVEGRVLNDEVNLGRLDIRVVDQPHGNVTSAGLIFKQDDVSLIYSTDFNGMTDEMENLFKGADCWVIDALRHRPHPTHCHLEQALGYIERAGCRHAVLTHMDQSMDYATLCATLPAHVEPGYDGYERALI
jgi:phosphoribosyl 1,2-cyclic phosphate phosphodiesterase